MSSDMIKVVIIDDDLFIAEVIQASLEMDGHYAVKVCSSAQEAFDCLKNFTPDIIIQDLLLEDMDGIDLVRYLKGMDNLSQTPVIVLTGSDETAIRRKALAAGAALFIQKPFAPNDLIRSIRDLID